jgi:hypothetical protein
MGNRVTESGNGINGYYLVDSVILLIQIILQSSIINRQWYFSPAIKTVD